MEVVFERPLSIESQAKSLFVAIAAPVLGWSVDLVGAQAAAPLESVVRFLPIAVLGIVVCGLMVAAGRIRNKAFSPKAG